MGSETTGSETVGTENRLPDKNVSDKRVVMLLGLYGGTFDPVHLGHIHVAHTVQQQLNMQSIRWLLAARPGHRATPQTPIHHRWQMLQLVCADEDGFIADDMEIKNPGTSYTLETLLAMREQHPHALPCWILGLDAYATLDEWYRWDEILNYANLIVVERPDESDSAPVLPPAVVEMERFHRQAVLKDDAVGQILRLDVPMLPISATEIRAKLERGESVEHLLAPRVSAYISEHQLYAEKAT